MKINKIKLKILHTTSNKIKLSKLQKMLNNCLSKRKITKPFLSLPQTFPNWQEIKSKLSPKLREKVRNRNKIKACSSNRLKRDFN